MTVEDISSDNKFSFYSPHFIFVFFSPDRTKQISRSLAILPGKGYIIRRKKMNDQQIKEFSRHHFVCVSHHSKIIQTHIYQKRVKNISIFFIFFIFVQQFKDNQKMFSSILTCPLYYMPGYSFLSTIESETSEYNQNSKVFYILYKKNIHFFV